MFGLSFSHLIFLGLAALILIGPEELPKVARTLGRLLNEIKGGSDSFKREFHRSTREFHSDVNFDPQATQSNFETTQETADSSHVDQLELPLTESVSSLEVPASVPASSLETDAVPSHVDPTEGKRDA